MIKKQGFTKRVFNRLIHSPQSLIYYFNKEVIEAATRKFFYRYSKNKSYFPKNIILVPTLRCNLNCISCNLGQSHSKKEFAQPFEKKEEISVEVWRLIIDKVSSFNPMISISGGEASLYEGTTALVQYIKSKKLYCSLTTNGTIFKEDDIKSLLDNKLDTLTVSFDGIGEVHDRIRGVKGAFDRSLSFLEALLAYKKEHRYHAPYVSVNCVMSSYNQSRLEEVADFFVKYDIDVLSFSHIWFYNKDMVDAHNKQYCGTQFEIKETIGGQFGANEQKGRDLTELWEKICLIKWKYHGLNISFFPDLKNFSELESYYLAPMRPIGAYNKCYAPWHTLELYPNGDVEFAGSCFHIPIGNLVKQNFDEVWNSEKFIAIRKKLREVDAFPICTRCCNILQGF